LCSKLPRIIGALLAWRTSWYPHREQQISSKLLRELSSKDRLSIVSLGCLCHHLFRASLDCLSAAGHTTEVAARNTKLASVLKKVKHIASKTNIHKVGKVIHRVEGGAHRLEHAAQRSTESPVCLSETKKQTSQSPTKMRTCSLVPSTTSSTIETSRTCL